MALVLLDQILVAGFGSPEVRGEPDDLVTQLVDFGASFVFADLLALPRDFYYLLYFIVVLAFLGTYLRRTALDLRVWLLRRLGWGVILGALGGLVLMRGVRARAGNLVAAGGVPWWDVLWRGIVYGSVDGLLLLAFPWIVVWRALGAEGSGRAKKVVAGVVAWGAILLLTTAYRLGYEDFRSRKILEPNIGSTIAAVPTLVTANPVASPVSHVVLHVTAGLHDPDSELYLPPHGDPARQRR